MRTVNNPMKHIKLFENFTLNDLEQRYLQAQDLVELGVVEDSELARLTDLIRIQRYIADGSKRGLYLVGTQIQSLGALTEVGGDLWLQDSQIQDLGALTKVDGNLWLKDSQIQDLGELREVGGNLWLKDSQIQDLGELREVGRNLGLKGTPIAKTHTEQEIREQVQVRGKVYL